MTAPFNDVQDKLGNALLERRTLKIKLQHAKGAKAIAIRERLATVNAAIDTLNGRMRDLKQRTVYSTINVTLEQAKSEAGGTGAAWDDAQSTLEGMLNFTVRALAPAAPARTARRTRRAGRPLAAPPPSRSAAALTSSAHG